MNTRDPSFPKQAACPTAAVPTAPGAALCFPALTRLPVAAYCCDVDGRVVGYNDAAAELWGHCPDPGTPAQWCGALTVHDAHGAPLARAQLPLALAIARQADVDGVALSVLRPDQTQRSIIAYAKLVHQADGAIGGGFCVLIDHTEREQLASELERAEDDRNAFLAMLAHELRNPLSPILSAAGIMQAVCTDTKICKMAAMMERQVKQLSRFVSDLLDASNLAQDGIVLQVKESSLKSVIDCAIDALTPHASKRGQHVAVELANADARLLCDPERVAQAVSNLLINASSFTDDGGHICLKVKVDDSLLEVDVQDNGIGIPPAQIDRIFQPYAHFSTHAQRLRSGAGLGLPLAKAICEQHGGLISASSPGPGRGSRFRLVLPIVLPSVLPTVLPSAQGGVGAGRT